MWSGSKHLLLWSGSSNVFVYLDSFFPENVNLSEVEITDVDDSGVIVGYMRPEPGHQLRRHRQPAGSVTAGPALAGDELGTDGNRPR